MTTLRLYDIAHARTGDKGDTCIIVLAPYAAADFDTLERASTPERIAQWFGNDVDNVRVTSSRMLGALTIRIADQLAGGVTRSVRVDPHGKTLAGHLLAMSVPSV